MSARTVRAGRTRVSAIGCHCFYRSAHSFFASASGLDMIVFRSRRPMIAQVWSSGPPFFSVFILRSLCVCVFVSHSFLFQGWWTHLRLHCGRIPTGPIGEVTHDEFGWLEKRGGPSLPAKISRADDENHFDYCRSGSHL